MTQDTRYAPVEILYKSSGLTARYVQDQAPPGTFLNLMNCLERTEASMSSRYGTQIINRDPAGTGTANYYFNEPVVSLARLTYQGQSYRYAGLEGGSLYRRTGDTQGQYTAIYTALSGNPFQWVVQNCFQSSQPYLFIYDAQVSIKDSGTGTPELTGIDPSPYTLNSIPYSPLLTLIDNFASGNSYTASGFSSAWSYAAVQTLTSTGGTIITDFPQFLGVNQPGAGTYTIGNIASNIGLFGPGSGSNPQTSSGFPPTSVTAPAMCNLQATIGGTITIPSGSVGYGTITYSYSADGGSTWTAFATQASSSTVTYAANVVTVSIPGVTNLSTVQVQVVTYINITSGAGGTTSGYANSISATISAPNVFGPATNGMLSVLGTTAPSVKAISSIVSATFAFGLYNTLIVTTTTPHGFSMGEYTSIYGASNDLVDGFYKITNIASATSYGVSYISAVKLSATGGFAYASTAAPTTCALENLYSTPYPAQMAAWGFYTQVPVTTASFPVGSWVGTVAQNTTATVGKSIILDLNINNQVTDDDLIVLTVKVGDPATISTLRLQFDVANSGYTSSYYYKDLAASYFQQGVEALQDAYETAEQQILADSIGLLSGQPPDSTTAQLQPGVISTGQEAWIAIYLRRGDFVPVGSAGESGLDWTTITGWQLVITTNTVGSTDVAVNGLYLQWGYGPSSFGGVGYDYRQTYFNANTGTESNGTPIQNFNMQSGYLASQTAPFYLRQAVQVSGCTRPIRR